MDKLCKKIVSDTFYKCVSGYHLCNIQPISEKKWEEINYTILNNLDIKISSVSNGNHFSGTDIECSIGNLSNKTTKYTKNYINISSYRLTSVCNIGDNGSIDKIFKEIYSRNNFDYYSILARNESNNNNIEYVWYMIPKDYYYFDVKNYNWNPKYGKYGKNKNKQIGWETNKIDGNYISITYSLSSQLWFHLNFLNLDNFIVSKVKITNIIKYDYIQLFNKLTL